MADAGGGCIPGLKLFPKLYWRSLFIICWPLILLPLLIQYDSKEMRCGFVVLMMGGFWVTEALPLPITSLIPLVLFPGLSILSSAETCACYMNDTIMVFIGGLVLAIAIEHSNLHMRIAIGVMKLVGCSHRKLLGGMIVVTAFLSMWISNTAATAMMIPIIFAVLQELESEGLGTFFESNPEDPNNDKKPTNVAKAYLLGAAYSATIGGTSTLVGTGTNLTFKGIFENTFPKSDGISFTEWMAEATPQALVNLVITYFYLLIMYMGMFRPLSQDAKDAKIGSEGEAIANRVISEKYNNLGKMKFHETVVAMIFFICIALWILRKPGFITGWAELISTVDIKDSMPIIMATIIMFMIPKDLSWLNVCKTDDNLKPKTATEGLVTWKVIESKMPWSLMFLLGGGFAISKGSIASCLSKKIGDSLAPLEQLSPFALMCIACIFTGTVTEVTSNIGVANIILPVIAQLSVAIKINPMYLMVPATIMCSYSFRLPVGTPPNAIVTLTGNLPVKDLMIGGCIPAIYSFMTVTAAFYTTSLFTNALSDFPEWAVSDENSTSSSGC